MEAHWGMKTPVDVKGDNYVLCRRTDLVLVAVEVTFSVSLAKEILRLIHCVLSSAEVENKSMTCLFFDFADSHSYSDLIQKQTLD